MQEQRVAPYLVSWKFATGIEICDHSFLKLLIAWFLMVEGQTVAARFELFFCSSEATLIPWSVLKKGFDCLLQFWSRSQTLP